MKRAVVLILFFCFVSLSTFAQQAKPSGTVTDKQWQDLLAALSDENWDTAVDLSSQYLKQLKDSDKNLPNLRYIYLYAAAGKVSEGGMSFEELEQAIKGFIGKEVILPYRPITQNCKGSLNFICPSDTKDRLMVAATNKTGTTIHAFEYVQLKESFDVASHEGEEASIGGTIEAIKPNPNKSRAIVMRIYISKGFIILKKEATKTTSLR